MTDQPPLFDLPDAERPAPRMAAPSRVVYARYRPAQRELCGDCIRDIHARGIAVAPPPMSARWRRSDGGPIALHLCERHKNERIERGE